MDHSWAGTPASGHGRALPMTRAGRRPHAPDIDRLLQLSGTAGNAAVAQMLAPTVQRFSAGDDEENEGDYIGSTSGEGGGGWLPDVSDLLPEGTSWSDIKPDGLRRTPGENPIRKWVDENGTGLLPEGIDPAVIGTGGFPSSDGGGLGGWTPSLPDLPSLGWGEPDGGESEPAEPEPAEPVGEQGPPEVEVGPAPDPKLIFEWGNVRDGTMTALRLMGSNDWPGAEDMLRQCVDLGQAVAYEAAQVRPSLGDLGSTIVSILDTAADQAGVVHVEAISSAISAHSLELAMIQSLENLSNAP